jgi:hypothetical protein
MSRCPICKFAKCRWIDLKSDPKKLTTEELNRVVDHNVSYIEMVYRDNNNGSAYAEERAYTRLHPYVEELEKRGAQ